MMKNYKTLNPLRISPTSFKSSLLSIPPSPFSPRTPLTPELPFRNQAQRTHQQSPTAHPQLAVYAPTSPLVWVWTCHQCHHSYRLGVTRRCLDDGHYYCSGTTTIKAWRKPKSSRRVKKHRACASEFDYSAWKAWGRLRRGGPGNKAIPGTGSPNNKDCWNICDYPSECKWGKKFGIHTPVETVFPTIEANTMPTLTAPTSTTLEGILKPENCKNIKTSKNPDKATFWTALVASAERKKSGCGRTSSPLNTATERDDDGDEVVTSPESPFLDSSGPPPSSRSSSPPSAISSLKALVSRKKYRRREPSPGTQGNNDMRHVTGVFAPKADDQVTLSDSEASQEGFEPLFRAQSKGHRGYQSCSV